MNERKKEMNNRKDHWLHEGIIVKVGYFLFCINGGGFQVITKKLGSDFYKAKGVVKSLIDEYTGSVKLDDGEFIVLNKSPFGDLSDFLH